MTVIRKTLPALRLRLALPQADARRVTLCGSFILPLGRYSFGEQSGLPAIPNTKLRDDARDIIAHSPVADIEKAGDFCITRVTCKQPQDFALMNGEVAQPGSQAHWQLEVQWG